MNIPAERPTTTLTFLELIDRTFRLYRSNFATFVGTMAIIEIPLGLIQMIISVVNAPNVAALTALSTQASPRNFNSASSNAYVQALSKSLGNTGSLSLLTLLVALVQTLLIAGTITYIASENYLGRNPTIREAFSGRLGRVGTLGCGYILFYMLIFVVSVVVGFIGIFCFPVLIGLVPLVYYAIATYTGLVPVLILENVGVFQGFNRAWALGKARFWTAFGLIIVVGLIVEVLNLAFAGIGRLLLLSVVPASNVTGSTVITQMLGIISGIFLTPLLYIGFTLFYHDTRNRLEGLDFRLQNLGTFDARPADVESAALPMGFSGRDWLNMLIILAVVVGLVIIVGAAGVALVQSLVPFLPTPRPR